MNPTIKNVLAVLAGIVAGVVVNMGLIMLGPSLIPPPEGVNVMDPESIAANMHLFESKHFIFPFLAHALGTLVGAFVVAKLTVSHHMKLALGIGAFFLLGGIANVVNLSAPMWFNVLDLVAAYIPMGWLGRKLAGTADER